MRKPLLKQFISWSLQSFLIACVYDTSFSSAEGAKGVRGEKRTETICSLFSPGSVTYCEDCDGNRTKPERQTRTHCSAADPHVTAATRTALFCDFRPRAGGFCTPIPTAWFFSTLVTNKALGNTKANPLTFSASYSCIFFAREKYLRVA